MIPFVLSDARRLLAKTPAVLAAMLTGLPDRWLHAADGPGTWSAHGVLAHLIDGEHVDWLPRLQMILEHGESRPFTPFDREGFRAAAQAHSTPELLEQFASVRSANIAALLALDLTQPDLDRAGAHPEFGRVTARQLLATWVAHDHGHLVQIHRTIARQYVEEVGPWRDYLSVIP